MTPGASEPRPDVLLADDDLYVREGVAALLERAGYAVRQARDGAQALAAFRERCPDLVVLDVMMPGTDGFAACEQIRAEDPCVPIVFLTALGGDESRVRALKAGADAFVEKTSSPEVLLAYVQRALARLADARAKEPVRELRLGSATVDLMGAVVRQANGLETKLTHTMVGILKLLASDRERAFSADEVLDSLRGRGFVCAGNLLYAHVARLREALGPAGHFVINERGVGYRLVR